MAEGLTIGDVLRRARKAKRWSQTQLGEKAAAYVLGPSEGRINKSTVVKVENDPYTSEFGTIWRLTRALGLTLADLERQAPAPFRESADGRAAAIVHEAVAEQHRTGRSRPIARHQAKRTGKP